MDNYPVRNPTNIGSCCGHAETSHNIGASTCFECRLVNPADTHTFGSSIGAFTKQPAINATGT